MIKVLVTGGKGQLASCFKDLENKYKDLNIIYTDHKELDICNLSQIKTFFKSNYKIDYCINCAAYTDVDRAESEVDKAFEINAQGPKNLALICHKFEAVLVHISTDFVFDGEKTEPYTEADIPNPVSVYGASKLKGEVEIQKIIEKYFIFRTSWLYSEHGNNFTKTMLRLAEIQDEINVVSDQLGSPTYAGDLAAVILKIINSKDINFGLYHYSNKGAASWFDFAKAIFEASNLKTKIIPIKTEDFVVAAKRPFFSVMDVTKIKRELKIETLNWNERLLKANILTSK
tara:strand:- start:15518 stop:16378 length:861 start_codon:yes stop_codon:yes gene_type:complete